MLLINKKTLILCLMSYSLSNAMVIKQESLSFPESLGSMSVVVEDGSFFINNEDGATEVPRHRLDKDLRSIPTEILSKMIATGAYLKVNKSEDTQEYSLDINQRVQGGGPVLGAFLAWMVRGVGYGIPVFLGTKTVTEATKSVLPAGDASAVNNTITTAYSTGTVKDLSASGMQSTALSNQPVVGFNSPNLPTLPAGSQYAKLTPAQEAFNLSKVNGLNGAGQPIFVMKPGAPEASLFTPGFNPTSNKSLAATGAATTATNATITKATIATGAGISMGVLTGVVVAKTVVDIAGVPATGIGLAGAVISTGGSSGYVTAVETASAAAGIAGNAVWWMP